MGAPKLRVDIDPQHSDHKGVVGIYERGLRKFKTFVYMATLTPLYFLGAILIGSALLPGIVIFQFIDKWTHSFHWLLHDLCLGVSLAVGFLLYGFSLALLVPLANFCLRTTPKPFRGPYYSVNFLPWYIHNALTYLVRYTFLEFITPTPLNLLFFQMMGMKVGRGCQINSSHISDAGMITMGRGVTIGGSATLCAHYGMDGYLVLSPVHIGDKVTIGLKASIMGGVHIGDGAKVLPHSVVLPKTVIPPGETWGGVPAVRLK